MTTLTTHNTNPWIRVIDISAALISITLLLPIMLCIYLYRYSFKLQAIEQVTVFSINDQQISLYQFSDGSLLGLSPRLINLLKGDITLIGEDLYYSIETPPKLAHKPGLFSLALQHKRMGLALDNSRNDLNHIHSSPKYYLVAATKMLVIAALTLGQKSTLIRAHIPLFGLMLSNFTMNELIDEMSETIASQAQNDATYNHTKQYAFINADCVNLAHKNDSYLQVLKQADHILGDGLGIRIAAQWLGYDVKANLNGTDMLPVLCQRLEADGKSIFLLGGQKGVAEEAANKIQTQYPQLVIAGTQDGFFSADETQTTIDNINHSGASVLLVAMGAPMQELWLAQHKHALNVAIAIGVGGLFDFYSERISRAPLGLRQVGMEWIWRLAQEPKRMWRRYILGNPSFLYKAARQAITVRNKQSKKRALAQLKKTNLTPDLLAKNAETTKYYLGYQLWFQSNKPLIASVCKRSFDILLSSSLLVLLMPLFIGIALLIRIESPGAVLYSQQRAGKHNRTFIMWKFRSMYIDAEQRLTQLQQQNEMSGGVLFKMKQDPRITLVGKFIRKASIDELPQLWNVLKGEMSLVGPRPALLSEVAQYQLSDRRRLEVKPGITCIWQVSGRSDIPFDRQVELDVDYIYQQSLAADIWLLVKTIPAVLLARGAY